jgi:anti-sigma B factor antagonist/stage II sporulation protein AA (anti-sigma F factor antagonist)
LRALLENFEIINVDGVFVIAAHLICPTLLEAKEFEKIVKEQVRSGYGRLVVDLSMCEHIDSTFLGEIIKTFKKLTSIGGVLRIIKPVKSEADIFILTNTLSLFNFYEKRDDAIKSFEVFQKINVDGVFVIAVNLTRSTLNEAIAFKKIAEEEINSGHTNLVIDLSRCEFIDSSFFGVIVISSRMMKEKGHKLKIVKPVMPTENIFINTNTYELFDIYTTREDAIKSFESSSQSKS